MSKATNNLILHGMSGMIGQALVIRTWRGRTILSFKPKPRKHNSPRQQACIDRFRKAHAYALAQANSPEGNAEYSARITTNKYTPYLVAISDYLNKPVIHAIITNHYHGAAGEIITVKATDDFKVVRVVVAVTLDGHLVEEGEACPDTTQPHIWHYPTTLNHGPWQEGRIMAFAYDKPGNMTASDVTILANMNKRPT